MNKKIFGCLGVAAVFLALQFTSAKVQAGIFSPCTPCDEVGYCDADNCDPCDAVCGTKAGKWFINGHIEAGFYANAHGATSTYTGVYGGIGSSYSGGLRDRGAFVMSGNTAFLQNTRLTNAQINQVYLSVGKSVDGRRGLDIGGTVDFTWGSDAYAVQASGMEITAKDPTGWGSGDYSAAFAQAYAEVAYKKWNVKAGKFYAPFGSTCYKTTDNFFYSWATTWMIAPSTSTGVYATYQVNDKLSVIGGWVTPEEFAHCTDNNFGLGGLAWNPNKRLSVLYTFAAGKECGAFTGMPAGTQVSVHSLVATTQVTKRVKYVFDWTLFNANYSGYVTASTYGLNNELIFQANKRWAFGTRFGMLHGNAYGYAYTTTDADLYTIALGANWTPNKWLTVKSEVRYDWIDPSIYAFFDNETSEHQFSGGMSAVVKF
ncbi:MAG: porin [Planctomycetaceae bacterium]|jgi:hypothetical protein|nr:porin [Planctomycetaceae bacterium]